jgi:sulfate permease, SulP family
VAHAALLDSGLPTLGLPDVTLHDYGDLARGRRGLMLVGFAEGLDAAKTYAARDQYDIDANRELIGLGGANLASGLSSGMVVTAASRRPPSTARPAPTRSSPGSSSPC